MGRGVIEMALWHLSAYKMFVTQQFHILKISICARHIKHPTQMDTSRNHKTIQKFIFSA